MPQAKIAYFRGEFCPIEEAKVSVRCKALNYGMGCFEGLRGFWRADEKQIYIFRMPEHYDRLRKSCKIVNVALPYSDEELGEITCELVRRNEHREDVYIRPLVFHGSEMMSPSFVDEDNEFTIYTLPLADYIDAAEGLKVIVSSWRRVSDNMIPIRAKPTGAYLNSALARHQARQCGCHEAIFLTQNGHVSEGSAEHIFLIRDGELVTPASQDDNLDGITRRTIGEIVPAELGRKVVVRRVGRTELYVAEEAFLCGTGAQVLPVTQIDGHPVGDGKPGPITTEVQELYLKVVRGEMPKYKHWCTPVYE